MSLVSARKTNVDVSEAKIDHLNKLVETPREEIDPACSTMLIKEEPESLSNALQLITDNCYEIQCSGCHLKANLDDFLRHLCD